MSEVALSIGGRTYRVACAAGEEDRVTRLGALVNEKLAAMGNLSGHDAQNLLFAAILLADEVHEGRDTVAAAEADRTSAARERESAAEETRTLRETVARLESEVTRLQSAHQVAADDLHAAQTRMAGLSERVAEHQDTANTLHRQLEDTARERDALAARLQDTPALPGNSAPPAELAPALERLAEMLEECADKLESAPAAS